MIKGNEIANMPPIDTIDERYQSYNVAMLQVTGENWRCPRRGTRRVSESGAKCDGRAA